MIPLVAVMRPLNVDPLTVYRVLVDMPAVEVIPFMVELIPSAVITSLNVDVLLTYRVFEDIPASDVMP